MTHACFARGALGAPTVVLTTQPEDFGGGWTCTSLEDIGVTAKATYYATRTLEWILENLPVEP